MADSMLTTVDNPFNPFVQWDEWYAFDEGKGYHTTSYLARICRTSNEMSDEAYNDAVESAINEILSFNLLGIYRKVEANNFDSIMSKPLTNEEKESLELLNGGTIPDIDT